MIYVAYLSNGMVIKGSSYNEVYEKAHQWAPADDFIIVKEYDL